MSEKTKSVSIGLIAIAIMYAILAFILMLALGNIGVNLSYVTTFLFTAFGIMFSRFVAMKND